MTHRVKRDRRKLKTGERKAYAKAAAKCGSGGVRDALTTTWTRTEQKRHQIRRLGSFGSAGPVVRIDPATMKPVEEHPQICGPSEDPTIGGSSGQRAAIEATSDRAANQPLIARSADLRFGQ